MSERCVIFIKEKKMYFLLKSVVPHPNPLTKIPNTLNLLPLLPCEII